MARKIPPILSMRIADSSMKTMNAVPPLIQRHISREAWRKQVTRALERGVKPAVVAAKAAARTLPSKGTPSAVHGRRNMRRKIAGSIESVVKTSARDPYVGIVSRRDRLPADAAYLPRRTNEGSWRHPVYNKGGWAAQTSRQGWFDNTIRKTANVTVRAELVKVLSYLESTWTK